MSGKMTKFKDLLVDTPNRYIVNGEVKTIVFAPNAVTQEGTKDKAEYFNEMQKNGLYNVSATRVVEGTVEFYDVSIEGSDIFDVFDTQFIINFNETNTKLNPVLRFNNNNYYIRALKGFIDIDVQVGSLQKTYIGFLDSANNKLKLFGNEKKLTFDTAADMQNATWLVEGDTVQLLGHYSKNDDCGSTGYISSTDEGNAINLSANKFYNYLTKEDTVIAIEEGIKGDSITDENVLFQKIIDKKPSSIFINKGRKVVAGNYTNNFGIEINGEGSVVKLITGGLQKLNSYADKHKNIFGLEYLAYFHNLIMQQSVTPTRKPIIVFSGDSTTEGVGVTTEFQLQNLLEKSSKSKGLNTAYGINCINKGHSGLTTEHWNQTYWSDDLSVNPDLLILRWGINDPGWLKNMTTPPIDAGQDYPNRRDTNDFITSLRSGLAKVRGQKSLSQLSIVLMSPNSTFDTPNGRDTEWYESINKGIRQACRDFKCTFIDTYAMWKDSELAYGFWMDDPMPTSGRAIHPANVMNSWIVGVISDVVFPKGLEEKYSNNKITSIGGVEDAGSPTKLPSEYNFGITFGRGVGYLLGGVVLTQKFLDDTSIQFNYPLKSNVIDKGRFVFRIGDANSWGDWNVVGSRSDDLVTVSSGYNVGNARMNVEGSMVSVEGYIGKSTPSVIPAGTIIANISVGYRPVVDAIYTTAIIYDNTNFAKVMISYRPNGDVVILETTTLNVARVYLNGCWLNK